MEKKHFINVFACGIITAITSKSYPGYPKDTHRCCRIKIFLLRIVDTELYKTIWQNFSIIYKYELSAENEVKCQNLYKLKALLKISCSVRSFIFK